MDCKRCRKFVGAFVDGELDVQLNVETLEHLNMCPECAKRAVEIDSLKVALVGMWRDERAPRGLRDRVASALEADLTAVGEDSSVPFSDSGGPAPEPSPAWSRLAAPIAVAAALVLSVGIWHYWPSSEPQPGTQTVYARRAVRDVREQHLRCAALPGSEHHDQSLTRNLRTVAQRLSERLRMAVIAPDLSIDGFRFVGADACGIQGRPGAHVLYRSVADQEAMSVFTVDRMAEFNTRGGRRVGDREYFVSFEDPLSLVAWHEKEQTYVACTSGLVTEDALLGVVDGRMRTAQAWPVDDRFASLARVDRP
jgi:anti-sigma factor RsiW